MYTHKENAANQKEVTTSEFVQVLSLITGKTNISEKNSLDIMETLDGFEKVYKSQSKKDFYYMVPGISAWGYFTKIYGAFIRKNKYEDIVQLVNRAKEYEKDHKNY